jgi:hypothetical protein
VAEAAGRADSAGYHSHVVALAYAVRSSNSFRPLTQRTIHQIIVKTKISQPMKLKM